MKLSLPIIAICSCVLQVDAWRPFLFRFSSMECEGNAEFPVFVNCSVVKVKRQQEAIRLNIRFGNILEKPKLNLLILTSRPQQEDFVLVNFTDVDGCKFLENKGGVFNILQILRNSFEKYSVLPNKCPVEKGTEIHVKDMLLDPDNFPPYVPETKFSVYVTLQEKSSQMMQLQILGGVEVKNRRGIKSSPIHRKSK